MTVLIVLTLNLRVTTAITDAADMKAGMLDMGSQVAVVMLLEAAVATSVDPVATMAVKRAKEESEEDKGNQRLDQWFEQRSIAKAQSPKRVCMLKGRSQLQEFVRSIDVMYLKFRVRNFEVMRQTGAVCCCLFVVSCCLLLFVVVKFSSTL